MIHEVKIYAIICPFTKRVKYVGKTKWILDILAKGLKPEIMLLEIVSDEIRWDVIEKKWINHFGLENLLNENIGGAGGRNGYNKNKYVIQFEQYLSKTYSKKTVSNYVSIVDLFIRHHKEGRNPKVINIKSVVKYLNQISDTNTRKVTLSALKNFYTNIINQPSKLKFIKYGYKKMV